MIRLRLSAFYFFYFSSLGVLIPYWGPYLKSLGFNPEQIGQLLAILMITKTLAPYFWAQLADGTGQRMRMVCHASWWSLLSFTGIFFGDSFAWIALIMMLFSMFWNASLPQFEAVTFNHLGEEVQRYALIRLWGSVGFIMTVSVTGWLLSQFGERWVPMLVALMLFAVAVMSHLVPDHPGCTPAPGLERRLWHYLQRAEIRAFLLACFFMQASHGVYYVFYSIYLQEHGYHNGSIGLLWALGVLAEVALFLGAGKLLSRYGARRLLLASLGLAVVRWMLMGLYPDDLALMIVAQCLHAGTFGGFHASAIHLVHHYFPGPVQGRGQALYGSLSFGLGGALGSTLSGSLWESFGSTAAYEMATVCAALGLGIAWRWVDPQRRY